MHSEYTDLSAPKQKTQRFQNALTKRNSPTYRGHASLMDKVDERGSTCSYIRCRNLREEQDEDTHFWEWTGTSCRPSASDRKTKSQNGASYRQSRWPSTDSTSIHHRSERAANQDWKISGDFLVHEYNSRACHMHVQNARGQSTARCTGPQASCHLAHISAHNNLSHSSEEIRQEGGHLSRTRSVCNCHRHSESRTTVHAQMQGIHFFVHFTNKLSRRCRNQPLS